MGFRRKKSPNTQKEPGPSASTTVLQKETDWVSNAFQVAELASAAGGLLPFPYLKGAAELVKTLLKPIQQMQQNQDNYKELTTTVTTTLQILHEETKKNCETAPSLDYFEKDCETFYRYLQHISDDLKSFNKSDKPRFLRGYFTADREKDSLVRYQNEIEKFRRNLMFRGMIRLQISSNTNEIDSDFERIRLGDLNVLKNSSNGQVEHWEVRWKQENQTRMVRVYKGWDADSKFKKEKEWYSRYRHPNVLQLFGTITSKESPGLIFHNPWCIPHKQFDSKHSDALGRYIDLRLANWCFCEGCDYVADGISHHAIISWRHLEFFSTFIGFKGREDGYLASCYVNVLDGRGLVVFEWSPNILQVVPASQWTTTHIDNMSGEEFTKITERVDMLHLSEKLNVPLDPLFLWDLYCVINVFRWKDVSGPAYSVYTGDILSADIHNKILDASDAAILGLIPCKDPLDWFVSNKILHTKVTVEDCGEHFRICVPVDTSGIQSTYDLQTVVVECDVKYLDRPAWELLVGAYISQIGCLLARADGMYECWNVCVVTGFSWHIQIPSRLRCSVGNSGYKELYFFISKPAVHDETLDTYWSLDCSGSERLYYSDMDTHGFDSNSFRVQIRRTLRVLNINYDAFNYIQEAHAVLGINPKSDKAARICGFPLICPIQPESGDVSDDSDRDTDSSEFYHTAEDEAEGGSVDACETEY